VTLNALPGPMIPHGTAMNNTLRQVAAALSTSILVTIMTTVHADMLIGAQITYKIITGIALIGLVLSFMYPKATGR